MAMAQIDPAIYDTLLTSGQQIAGMDPQIAYQQELAKRIRAASAMPGMLQSGRIAARPSVFQYLNNLVGGQVAQGKEQSAMDLLTQQQGLRTQQMRDVIAALQRQRMLPNDPSQAPIPTGQQVNEAGY